MLMIICRFVVGCIKLVLCAGVVQACCSPFLHHLVTVFRTGAGGRIVIPATWTRRLQSLSRHTRARWKSWKMARCGRSVGRSVGWLVVQWGAVSVRFVLKRQPLPFPFPFVIPYHPFPVILFPFLCSPCQIKFIASGKMGATCFGLFAAPWHVHFGVLPSAPWRCPHPLP